MPPNSPNQEPNQPNTDDHRFLIHQLKEALETTRELSGALDQECIQNAVVRAELTKDLTHLGETVEKIDKLIDGNGGKSIKERLSAVEIDLKRHLATCTGKETTRGNNIVMWIGIIAAAAAIISAMIQVIW